MDLMQKITALAKRRGFIFQSSEIYGGYQGFWDYGPAGVELKKNIKNEWWKTMVYGREDVVGIDASIVMNPTVWEKSGHLAAFTDPLIECKNCNKRYRADHLLSDEELAREQDIFFQLAKEIQQDVDGVITSNNKTFDVVKMLDGQNLPELNKNYLKLELNKIISSKLDDAERKLKLVNDIIEQYKSSTEYLGIFVQYGLNKNHKCPNCEKYGFWSEPKTFNLMTEVLLGTTEPKEKSYLRGEITQGVFVNFKNVVDSTRVKIPFGIAQIGKAFRNEVTPGNLTFRSKEFEQMELEYFVKPSEVDSKKVYEEFKEIRLNWYKSLGMNQDKLHFADHAPDKRAHYAKYATDIEYEAPFGWSEMEGIHHRGDYDLGNHGLKYYDGVTNEEYTPWVIETSGGVDRATLFFLIDAYTEDGERVYLKLNPKIAPYKVAVFPLLGNKPDLIKKAREIYQDLKKAMNVTWDDRGNIGKRYFAQDEIGTPWCVTVDFDTEKDNSVTVRDRDTGKQERIAIDNLSDYFQNKLR